MYFLFNRTTLQVFVTYVTVALYVHPLWFYRHQHDNRVRSKLSVACQRWWFQRRFPAILVNCAPTGEMYNYCIQRIIKDNFESFLIHRCVYVLLSQVYCIWLVVKTPKIIFNNPVYNKFYIVYSVHNSSINVILTNK
jgi:small-conductance mechanosensitive channel